MFYAADQDGHPDAPKLGHVYVSVGSLADAITQAPVSHVSYEEKVPWYQPTDGLPKFRGKTNERIA